MAHKEEINLLKLKRNTVDAPYAKLINLRFLSFQKVKYKQS